MRISLIVSAIYIALTTSSAQAFEPNEFSTITAAQKSKVSAALTKSAPKSLVKKITEASQVIQPFLERNSCMNVGNRSLNSTLNVYAAPGSDFTHVGDGPAVYTKYHTKSECMSVAKVNGWSSPSRNALRFEVLYISDSSGETVKHTHELSNRPMVNGFLGFD